MKKPTSYIGCIAVQNFKLQYVVRYFNIRYPKLLKDC